MKHQEISISPATKGFLDSLKKALVKPEFQWWNGKQVLVNISKNAITSYFCTRFDTLKFINRISLSNDEFYFKTNNGYGIYNTQKRKMYLTESIYQNPVRFSDSLTISVKIDKKERYIIDQDKIKYIDNDSLKTFLINYGINKNDNINYLDENIFCFWKNDQLIKIAEYPKGYLKQYREVRGAYYCLDSVSHIYYTLPYSDSLYKMNINGQYIKASVIARCRPFNEYLEKDKTDLAYKRRYLATSEQNIALQIIEDKYIVVLRRKKQPDLYSPPEYLIAIFDLKLNRLFLDQLKADITSEIFHYGKNIFFLAKDFSKIFEYEID